MQTYNGQPVEQAEMLPKPSDYKEQGGLSMVSSRKIDNSVDTEFMSDRYAGCHKLQLSTRAT